MQANRAFFDRLVRSHRLAFQRGPIFDYAPGPMPPDFDFSRVEGMLLGLAVGDALGNTSESLLPSERHARLGEVRGYLPNHHAGGRRVGLPSDDTQLAFWTLEAILEDGGLDPERLDERLTSRRVFGIGSAMKQFIGNHKAGSPWHEAGARSAGNGALMRIAPVLVPHLTSGTADLWVDVAFAAALTHNDPGSTAACVAFVRILWDLLRMERPPEPLWWVDSYVEVARDIEGDASYAPRGGAFTDYDGPIWRFVAEQLARAHQSGLSVRDACDRWWSGAYLLETVPCVLYTLMCHGADPEEAIVRAVNDTKDNDTIAAMVGAAVGALHGREGLPARWIDGLLGRTTEDDDGRIFQLLSEARDAHTAAAVVKACFAQVEVGDGQQTHGLTIFPLLRKPSGTPGYLTLDEALINDQLEVTEVGTGGSVPELKAVNSADEMVLLVEGDQLVGAKQNRTVNTTLLVAAHSELTIPVSCVEAGRWHSVSHRFRPSRHHCHPSLRRTKVETLNTSLREGRGYRSDQGAVWGEVGRTAAQVGARSATQDYEAVHDVVAQEVGDLADRVRLPKEAVGVAVAMGARIELIELFDRPETLRRLWGKLSRGYGLEAASRRVDREVGHVRVADDVRQWLRKVADEVRTESYPSPGLGRDIRIETEAATGAALVVGGEVVHCVLFGPDRPS